MTTETIELNIEKALLTRAKAFAVDQDLTIELPNVTFTVPPVAKDAAYLRATWLPATTNDIGISYGAANQYIGLLQIDVFYSAGGGSYPPGRIAGEAVDFFKRGTKMLSVDGYSIEVTKPPYRSPAQKDGAWTSIAVRIPYEAFISPAG